MTNTIRNLTFNGVTAAAVFLFATASTVSLAQPTFGNPSPTAGTSTSQKANAAADVAAYKPVEYVNKGKRGPALVVIPGEVKSNNATFVQKFGPNNIADFARARAVAGQFPGARAHQPGQPAAGDLARLQPGRPGQGAQDHAGRQAQDHQVDRQVRHPQGRADRREQARASTAGRSARSAGSSAAAARSRARAVGFGADAGHDRGLADRHALQDHGRQHHRAGRPGLPGTEDGSRRQRSTSVLGVSQGAKGGVGLDTMVQRLVQTAVWEIDSKYK